MKPKMLLHALTLAVLATAVQVGAAQSAPTVRGTLQSNVPTVYFFNDFDAQQGLLLLSPGFQTLLSLEDSIDKVEAGDASLFDFEPGDNTLTLRGKKAAGSTDLTVTTVSGLKLPFRLVIRAKDPQTRRYEVRWSDDMSKASPVSPASPPAPAAVPRAPKPTPVPQAVTPPPTRPLAPPLTRPPVAPPTPTPPTPAPPSKDPPVDQGRNQAASSQTSSADRSSLRSLGQMDRTSSETLPANLDVDLALLIMEGRPTVQYHLVNRTPITLKSLRKDILVTVGDARAPYGMVRDGVGLLRPGASESGKLRLLRGLESVNGRIQVAMTLKGSDGNTYMLSRTLEPSRLKGR